MACVILYRDRRALCSCLLLIHGPLSRDAFGINAEAAWLVYLLGPHEADVGAARMVMRREHGLLAGITRSARELR